MSEAFRELTLADYPLFKEAFKKLQPTASEFTFPYLYMWRKDYNIRFAVIGEYICLVSNSRIAFPFAFCPIPLNGYYEKEGFELALRGIEDYFTEKGYRLAYGRIEENCVTLFRDYYQDRIEAEYLEDASDYVYNAEDLIKLAGRKYSGKRNHISQFLRYYPDYEYVPVDRSNLGECKRILDEWCEKNETECMHPDNCERLACYDLLDNWELFNLKGALIKVNGIFEAFTVGEILNDETAVIRIEKGNSDVHGVYGIINREFCTREWCRLKYINREEDLGKEGIRKAKLSYYPVNLIKKYLIRVKEDMI